jgi:hypothetical protein
MVKAYLRHLVTGVLHLHRNGLTHNRLNLETVQHDGKGRAIINWFLSSKGPIMEQQKKKHFYFFPPETLLSRNYYESQQNDVWAIGCIALQLHWDHNLRTSAFHPYNRRVEAGTSESSDVLRKVHQLMDIMGLTRS